MNEVNRDSNYWRKWWSARAREAKSDFELNRLTSLRDKELEEVWEKRKFDFIDPRKDDFIFDAGCGSGDNLSKLYSKVKGIVSMDFSDEMITRCKERAESENIVNVRLGIGDIAHVGIRDNTFNKIICMSVLHYMNDGDCEAALRELVKVSKNEATLILHVKNLSSLYGSTLLIAKKIKRLIAKKPIMEHYRTYRWYKRKLFELGAEIVDYYSSNIFVIDILPRYLYDQIRRMEAKHCKGKLLGKYGADLHLKVRIKKY
jgi:ubiquinone/menaquinone biosynthesis C-methylase UbiE